MTTPIVRMYKTQKQARDAVGKLGKGGFPKGAICLVTPSAGDAESSDVLAEARKAGFVPKGQDKAYAEHLQKGLSLVSVLAPFGKGQLATNIMTTCKPVATEVGPTQRRFIPWDQDAPLSSSLMMSTLVRDDPAPLSRVLNRRTLVQGRTFRSPKYAELKSSDLTFSSRFGAKLLIDSPAPLSSHFRLKPIVDFDAPSRAISFNSPLLLEDPAPLSTKLNMHTLLTGPLAPSEPATFSAHLGLPTLWPGRSFMSRIFGELVSPDFAVFGHGPLSQDATPFSKYLDMGILSGNPHPLSTSWDLRVLSDNKYPLSSVWGLPLLTNR